MIQNSLLMAFEVTISLNIKTLHLSFGNSISTLHIQAHSSSTEKKR